MATRTIHLCVDIRGMIRNLPSGDWDGCCRENGRVLTRDEMFTRLCDALAEGKKVLPAGDECEGFSYETGCPGHPHKEEQGDE
jgi:hypothetical protein